jgi:tetratricopeptide (TPR) repeat protein
LMESDNLLLAEKHFLKMTENYPEFSEAENKLATVLYMLGKYPEAITSCKKVTFVNPNHFGAWNGMGLCQFQLGHFDEAIISFQKALEIQPYAEGNAHYIARCRGNLN